MEILIVMFALATFISTLIGGLLIIKFRKFMPYFFAFAAGSLIAVSFLDLLPESLEIAENINFPARYILLTIVASFFFYSLLERFFLTHQIDEHDSHGHALGVMGAGSLVIHSFLDGAAIGAAFAVNVSTGIVVALAVLSHDFTDGINTVTLMLKNKHKIKSALIFLVLDALAPVAGVLIMSLILIPQNVLALILAVFIGEFLYIGASNLLPETREHKSKSIIIALALGILLITILTSVV